MPVVTVGVEATYVARIEAHVVSVVAGARAERTRPVVGVTARIVEIVVVEIARSRKKNGVTVYFTC